MMVGDTVQTLPPPSIRPASQLELTRLQEIESAAGAIFADWDMGDIAADEPFSIRDLARYLKNEGLWVRVDPQNQPIAYVLVDQVDGCAHIEQISVHPVHAGKRLGAQLIDWVDVWAQRQNLAALTLTTFRDIPWNAPYYQRCGFLILAEEAITPGLAKIRLLEAEHGLDRWPRVCMRRDIGCLAH